MGRSGAGSIVVVVPFCLVGIWLDLVGIWLEYTRVLSRSPWTYSNVNWLLLPYPMSHHWFRQLTRMPCHACFASFGVATHICFATHRDYMIQLAGAPTEEEVIGARLAAFRDFDDQVRWQSE